MGSPLSMEGIGTSLILTARRHSAAGDLLREARNVKLEQMIRSRKFRNPETGNMVEFSSLPPEVQARIRSQLGQGQAEPDEKQVSSRIDKLRGRLGDGVEEVKKFVMDSEYRRSSVQGLRDRASDLGSALRQELKESSDMLRTFGRIMTGRETSKEDREAAAKQAMDVVKMAVLGASSVAPIPGTTPLLMFSGRVIGRIMGSEFSWMPSAMQGKSAGADDPGAVAKQFVEALLRGLDGIDMADVEGVLKAAEQD